VPALFRPSAAVKHRGQARGPAPTMLFVPSCPRRATPMSFRATRSGAKNLPKEPATDPRASHGTGSTPLREILRAIRPVARRGRTRCDGWALNDTLGWRAAPRPPEGGTTNRRRTATEPRRGVCPPPGGYDRGRKGQLCTWPLPPPNRACGSPAHGSPVGGLTSKRADGPPQRLRVWRTTLGR